MPKPPSRIPLKSSGPPRMRFADHAEKWADGCGASICSGASKKVFARGQLPCDILFIGEAPGESENVLGKPFVGPAGKLLDHIIQNSVSYKYWQRLTTAPIGTIALLRLAMTNIVGCIPYDEDGAKVHDPPKDCVKACSPRLIEFVQLAQPKMIVLVGTAAGKGVTGQNMFGECLWLGGRPLEFLEMHHPSYILRQNVSNQGLLVQKAEVQIDTAVDRMMEHWEDPIPF